MKLKELIKKVLIKEIESIKGKTFTTTQTDVDPETGKISWDVEYEPDFAKLLKDIITAEKTAYAVISDKNLRKDKSLKEIAVHLKDLKNFYRDHLRNEYPGEYEKVKRRIYSL